MEYSEIIKNYPWIFNKGQNLIISPDSDGFLASLLYQNYFGAKVVGYYDCKILVCKKGINPRDCLFLDIDIFNQSIKSIGHHMVCFNKNKLPKTWHNYSNCIQLNNLRNFDFKTNFQNKYPFATIHFLLSILDKGKLRLHQDSIIPLLFSDGVCNNLFGYPENCLDWFKWMNIDKSSSVLNDIFYSGIPFSVIMDRMSSFFKERDSYNSTSYYDMNQKCVIQKKRSRSGHHLLLTLSDGEPINLIKNTQGTYDIYEEEVKRTCGFISLMAGYMNWDACLNKWIFNDMELYKFTKQSAKPTLANYLNIMESDCFSLAIGSGLDMEYTLDTNHYFSNNV